MKMIVDRKTFPQTKKRGNLRKKNVYFNSENMIS